MATSYRHGNRRRSSYPQNTGRIAKPNRRPGACHYCGEEVPAHGGQLYRETSGEWSAVHAEASQGGWLMNPQPVTGGCPADTDKRNAELHAAGFFGKDAPAPRSERDRIASTAARAAATATSAPRGTTYTTTGERRGGRYGRCEDAPCCGCCD